MIFHCANYFLAMLFTDLGSRRHEFAGLMLEEIFNERGIWAIEIKANKYPRIKNPQSNRVLPIPDELIRLNFLEYVDRLKELGHELLFLELNSPLRESNDLGDRFYKDFGPIAKMCMQDELWKRPIHALRHRFSDTLKQAGISEGTIEDLSGRLRNTETSTRYTNPAGLPLLREILENYPISSRRAGACSDPSLGKERISGCLGYHLSLRVRDTRAERSRLPAGR